MIIWCIYRLSVFVICFLAYDGLPLGAADGGASEQDVRDPEHTTSLPEWDTDWVLSTPSTDSFDELVQQERPAGRDLGKAEDSSVSTTSAPPAGGRPVSYRRPNYFLSVTVPWTLGMLATVGAFLWVMRTDGPVYRVLTQSYTPPAARQQAAEERRRERIAEGQRTAQSAWESERARWRAQRSQRSGNSVSGAAGPSAATTATSLSTTVSWAKEGEPAAQR